MKENTNIILEVVLLILFIVLIAIEGMLNIFVSGILWTLLCVFGIYVLASELRNFKNR